MRDFKRQRGRQAQYLRMAVGLSLMAVLMLVAGTTARAAWGMYGKFSEAAAADAAEQAQLRTLQNKYETVSAAVAELETPRGIGAAVRQRYGMGLPGEHEIHIVRQASSTDAQGGEPKGFFGSLWQALFVW